MATHIPGKQLPLRSLTFTMKDIENLYNGLTQHVNEQADIEINALEKPKDQKTADFKQYKIDVRKRAFRVTVTITGTDGSSLFGDDISIFTADTLPDVISSIYLTNVTAYRAETNVRPVNSFEIFLDLSKPPLLDSAGTVSTPTPNKSSFDVLGNRAPWVSGIYETVKSVFRNRKSKRGLLHGAFSYDAGLFFAALPLAFYVSAALADEIDKYLGSFNSLVLSAAYLYIFLSIVVMYRFVYSYTKWAFPSMELEGLRDKAPLHRKIWFSLLLGILGKIIWSLWQWQSS